MQIHPPSSKCVGSYWRENNNRWGGVCCVSCRAAGAKVKNLPAAAFTALSSSARGVPASCEMTVWSSSPKADIVECASPLGKEEVF